MQKLRTTLRNAFFGVAVAAAALLPASASAEVYLTENFDYASATLYGQGGWIRQNTFGNDAVSLSQSTLTYPDYQDEAAGNAAKLTGATEFAAQQERLQKQIFENETAILNNGDVIYLSALVSVQTAPAGGDVNFLSFNQRNSRAATGYSDGKAGSLFTKVFTCAGDADGKFKFGLSKTGANASLRTGDLDLNQTYLLVLKFEKVEGTTGTDISSMWVNPAKGTSDPSGALAYSTGANATFGIQGISLYQGTTSTKTGSDILISNIRMASTYGELWGAGEGGGDNPDVPVTGSITAPASVDFGSLLQFQTATQIVNVKAQGITGPVTVTCDGGITSSATTISAEEAQAGYDLTLTYRANMVGSVSGKITLSAEGADPVEIKATAQVEKVTGYARLNFYNNLTSADEGYYQFQFKSGATVTYIDAASHVFYLQDLYGSAAVFNYEYFDTCPVKVGQKITDFYSVFLERSSFTDVVTNLLLPFDFTVVSEGNTVTAQELSLSDLAYDPSEYVNRLVTISDITFSAAGQNFGTALTDFTSGSASGKVRAFGGSDLIGTEIPAEATSITGIVTSAKAVNISMRSKEDLVAKDGTSTDPAITLTPTLLISSDTYVALGESKEFARITVEYANLGTAQLIYMAGSDRDMFTLSADEIPAGTGTMDVTVTFTPTKTGLRSANFTVYSDYEGLSQSVRMSARAYDPDNMPSLTVDTSALTPFSAAVGSTHEQTFSYTAANGLSLGTVKILNPNGMFILSTSSVLQNGTAGVKISFKPTAAGTYTQQVELSTELCDPITFTISGTAAGSGQGGDDRQGDELTDDAFSTLSPKVLVTEDFTSAGETNRPLAIEGWKNFAVEGNRASWAYTFSDDANTAAKFTAYDFFATDRSDLTILLLSPCLDYRNAAERLLTFRVMGDLMADGGTGLFQALYIEPDANAPQDAASPLDKLYIEPLGGLNIPATADYNGEWTDYVVDLEGLDLADAFFIGFSYSASRSKDFPAVYYLDDFSWGRADIPFIRTDLKTVTFTRNGSDFDDVEINVSGLNLTEEIAVSVSGQHAANFTTDLAALPAEGGKVKVSFATDKVEDHQAYVRLSSAGAPDTYVELNVPASSISGIENVAADDLTGETEIFTISGIKVKGTPAPGIYIVRKADGTFSRQLVK